MKKAAKSLLTLTLAFIISLINANTAFAAFLTYPDYHFTEPTYYNAVSVSDTSLEDVLDTEAFVNYLVEQLKVTECDTSDGSSNSELYGFIDISSFKIPYSEEMWELLTSLIWYNSPELFRINGMAYSTSSGKITKIVFIENYGTAEYTIMLEEMYSSAEKLLNGIKGNENLTDVEKALLLHDRLALLCEYDYDSYLNGKNNIPESSYNAYGVLVLNDAVCKGYTLAYDYLLEQIGIKSEYCSSDELYHAWNIVYIDDIPYHVDVTWDDPVWDVSGRVHHNNFLRSTAGLIETGHIADGKTTIDYNSTPTDTTYDNYFWQEYETAFQLLNDKIYCFNKTDKNIHLLKSNDGSEYEIIKNLPAKWSTTGGLNYISSFSRLISDGEFLYYSTPDAIMKFDPETNVEAEVFKPDLTIYSEYFWIYGFNIKDETVICEIYSSENFNASVKKNYTQTYKLTEELLIPDENTTIDEENNIIFSEKIVCKNIEEICTTAENITCSIIPSATFNGIEYLGTGSVATLYKNDEKVAEYIVVINGDLDGDSVCDAIDIALAEMATTNTRLPSALECYAANGSTKDIIDISSFQNVVNMALDTV